MPQRNKGQDSGLTLEWDSQGLCSGVSSGITHPGIMGSLPNSLYPFPRAAETSVTNHVTWNNRDVSLISPFWRMKSEIKVSARSGSFWNLEGSIFPCLLLDSDGLPAVLGSLSSQLQPFAFCLHLLHGVLLSCVCPRIPPPLGRTAVVLDWGHPNDLIWCLIISAETLFPNKGASTSVGD